MTEPVGDDSLVARVAAAPTPEERAALLGLDYAHVVAVDRRFRWINTIMLVVVTLPLFLPVALTSLISGTRDYLAVTLTMLLGVLVAVVLVGAGLIITSALLALPVFRQWSTIAKQLFFGIFSEVLMVAGIIVATLPNHSIEWLAGILIGTAAAQGLAFANHLALKPALAKNTKSAVPVAHVLAEAPSWLSLFHGPLRWVIWALIASAASAMGTLLLVWVSPLAGIPAAALLVAVGVVAFQGAQRDNPRLWLAPQIAAAALLLAAGLTVFLTAS